LWWFWGFEEVVGGFVNLVLEGASFFFSFFFYTFSLWVFGQLCCIGEFEVLKVYSFGRLVFGFGFVFVFVF
jgi:hypothetical protein